jgi:hypothetical protein
VRQVLHRHRKAINDIADKDAIFYVHLASIHPSWCIPFRRFSRARFEKQVDVSKLGRIGPPTRIAIFPKLITNISASPGKCDGRFLQHFF